jgi:hypothetical protein
METKSCFNAEKIFTCKICDYTTSKKSSIDKHLLTSKHTNRTILNKIEHKKKTNDYSCKICKKIYKARNSLWYHEQKCIKLIEEDNQISNNKEMINLLIKENIDFKNIILDLVKNNGDLQKQMLDGYKSGNTTNINNNSHNKTFNLQVFLNEECKDAMNIMDFVNSMTLQLSDLEDVGNLGYVEGISKIIIQKLNEIDIYKRPIHCSDGKRDTVYVRDNDVWEKENTTYDKLRKAIKYITKKNGDLLVPWSEKHPSCMNIEHPKNDVYMRLMNQAMGGKEEFVCSENKIIKKISKAVYLNKI